MKRTDPIKTTAAIRRRALRMLREFDAWPGLHVVLIGAPEPRHSQHKIRVVASQNPPWYRKFTEQFCVARKRETRARPNVIKREQTKTALQKITDNRAAGVQCQRLVDWIVRELDNERTKRQAVKDYDDGEYMPF